MASDWFSVLDRIDDFNLEKSKSSTAWRDWFTQYKILLRATAFEMLPNNQKVALLLMKCKGFKHVWDALSIDEDTIEYDDLVAKLNHYFIPAYARNAFFSRQQKKNETIDEFANALKALSLPCHFQDNKIVRDAFVLNINNVAIADQLLISGDPSFEEAIHRAKSLAHEPESSESFSDAGPEEQSDIFRNKYVLALASTKMPLITEGTHKVEVIGSGPNGLVFVVPTNAKHARDVFLDGLQRLLKGCNEPAATPLKGCSYSALVNCIWYRVIVVSLEAGKKARAESVDFGWTKLLPFTVFRNTPLDCRVVSPLLWTVTFRRPEPAQVLPGAHLTVRLTQVNNEWVASLEESTVGTNKGDYKRSRSPFSRCEDRSLNRQSRQHFHQKNKSGGQRNEQGATEDFSEKRHQARSETRGRVTDDLPADPRSKRFANPGPVEVGQSDVGHGVQKKPTGSRESADDGFNSDGTERTRGQRENRSRDGNHNYRQGQGNFKRNSQEKDSGYTRSESARNDNPVDNRIRGHGGFTRDDQEKDRGYTESVRAKNDNPPTNPFRGQGDDFTKTQQETNNNWFPRNDQSRNGNPPNQPFRNGDRHAGWSNQTQNGNLPNDRPFSRAQGDFNRSPRESQDKFTGNNQPRYPPSNRPFRAQGDFNRNSKESDDGFAGVNQPRNGYHPSNRPSINPSSDKNDYDFTRTGSSQGGYLCAPTGKPVTSLPQPGFTPRPIELSQARNASTNNNASAQPEPSDEFNRSPRESQDRFTGNNQPRYPPSNRPFRAQGDFNRNSKGSDDGFAGVNQPRNGYPPSNRPSINPSTDKNDYDFTRTGSSQGGYQCTPTGKPVTSLPQPGFTPRPIELSQARNASTNNASAQPEPSVEFADRRQLPIPVNQFSEVAVTYSCNSTDVFCTVKAVELGYLTEELQHVQRTVLSDLRIGMWCLALNECYYYRAEIFRVHPTGERVKVRYFDYGEVGVCPSKEVMVLPQKYHKTPPYAFGIKVPEGVEVREGDIIWVKPLCEDADGIWSVEVQRSAPPTQPAGSTRSPTPPRRPQLPPIPKNIFSTVRVMYTGREGNFVVEVSKLDDLKRIQGQILEIPRTGLQGVPEIGGIYVAPYEGELFRAKVLSADAHTCVVSFVDFGNEAEVRASDLIILPKQLQTNVHTFKVILDPDSGATLTDGSDIKVTPIIMESSGAWLVQVEGEPSNPHLHEDASITFNQQ